MTRRYRFISENAEKYKAKRLCRVLQVERSGYYAWRAGAPAPRRGRRAKRSTPN
jgi:hypothetical protein